MANKCDGCRFYTECHEKDFVDFNCEELQRFLRTKGDYKMPSTSEDVK